MYGFITLPLVPMRASDSERSEMISQLLFGEYVKILEKQDKWFFVENLADNYSGWVNSKMITAVAEADYHKSQKANINRLFRPFNIIYNTRQNQTKFIPGGSLVYDLKTDDFIAGDETWSLIEPDSAFGGRFNAHRIIETAMQYINAPYLWGGKTVMGIDCSGLVQVVYAIGGHFLPRDASQQVEQGELVDFLSESLPGDLAFFGNDEGVITHVGILSDNANIIHASGWVKVESIDSQGIISSITGEYTHQLRVIKRII
ncbi:MAG: C40 family peptidase [Paludibacter sp.]|nr:C40 family peptidase [Paludibacter sp.]MDD4199363.1 C40 family peptidase [Paludibacter sp.]MDD4428807.1 C40 family peptidase [Paludibacter sp.]